MKTRMRAVNGGRGAAAWWRLGWLGGLLGPGGLALFPPAFETADEAERAIRRIGGAC